MTVTLSDKPMLGVVAHDYLRVHGLLRMKQDVRLAVFGPADSRLHEVADVSIPLPTLDMTDEELSAAVTSAVSRGVKLDGLVSMRDGNVLPVAQVCEANGWPGIPVAAATTLRSKYTARRWFNDHLPPAVHTPVATVLVEPGLNRKQFYVKLLPLLDGGALIFKAARGSCKSFVERVERPADLKRAWRAYKAARSYRGGQFVAERMVVGREVSVETAVVNGQVVKVLITDYLPQYPGVLAESGHVAPAAVSPEQYEAVYALSVALHTGLRVGNAVTHTEMFLLDPPASDPAAIPPPAIVEVNPRLGGDLIPLLHLYATGTDLYRVAARACTGLPVTPELLGGSVEQTALIRFTPPGPGVVGLSGDPAAGLCHPRDEARLLFPAGTRLGAGTTNDDRAAYALVIGTDGVADLDRRAKGILRSLRGTPVQTTANHRRLVDKLLAAFACPHC